MLAALVALVLALIAVVLVVAARRPDTFHLERRIDIHAPAAKVFDLIDNFHHWTLWSPWEGIDPELKRTYTGAERGVGAGYAWEGNSKVGSGSMQILEAEPSTRVRLRLDFLKPFEAHNQAVFTIATSAAATTVTWAMNGPQAFPMKVMGLFMSMDSMVGKDFEKGLAAMKAVAEGR